VQDGLRHRTGQSRAPRSTEHLKQNEITHWLTGSLKDAIIHTSQQGAHYASNRNYRRSRCLSGWSELDHGTAHYAPVGLADARAVWVEDHHSVPSMGIELPLRTVV
jgi:hypothetical protein